MAENENCFNCVYSYWDPTQIVSALSGGFPLRPSCANHPDAPGRMQPLSGGRICRNYRPRTAAPEGDVKQIPLGQGLFAYADAADFEWLNQWTWHLHSGYAARCEKKKLIFMHREIVQPSAGMIVDHRNRNKLDNTRCNLRNCTHAENARNRGKRQGASSRFIGVGRLRHGGKWYARVGCQDERFWLGRFTDEIEAARAHDRAAVEYLGDAARLNFPEEWPPQRRQQVHSQRAAANEPVGANHHSPAPRKGRNAGAGKRKTCGTKKAKRAKRKTQDARRKKKSSHATDHRPRTTAAKARRKK